MTDDIICYQELWQEVVLRAISDATTTRLASGTNAGITATDQAQAKAWFGTKDFFTCCSLAGWDGRFVLEAYRNGRVTQEKIRQVVRANPTTRTVQ